MVKSHPDSIYGDRMPVNLQRDTPPPPHQTTTDTDDNTGEDPVDTLGQVHLNHLVREEEVEFLCLSAE